MKKLFTVSLVILTSFSSFAQIPQKMSYQCVVRNSNSALVTNQSVGIRISILQGTSSGTVIYQETYNPNPQTNANGLVSIEIGGGLAITGTFSAIAWDNGPYFLKTETDPTGGTNYNIISASQLLSVPYAIYAKSAGNGFSGNYYDLTNKPTSLAGYGITDAVVTTGDQTIAGNKTFTNDLSINGLTIGRGNGAISTNAAFGNQALSFNTDGYNNTAVGYQAILSNISGNFNTANGYWALRDNTSGSFNTANGSHALYFNTTGIENTAIGFAALASNTTGNSNTANGSTALNLTTTGNNNTAYGFRALCYSLTGNNNTAIGYGSLSSNRTGQNNTALGYGSDVGSENLTNATAVGYNTIVDASDKVRIGNSNVTVIEGQVAFTSASDERLKKNIKDLTNGLDFITKLRPVEYQMRKGDDKINYGFIAQDIEKLVGTNNSLLTIGGDANRTLGLRYTDFIAPIVKAIQEQQLTIKEQQKEIDELKELVKTLMKK
jgi:hypothetical protein